MLLGGVIRRTKFAIGEKLSTPAGIPQIFVRFIHLILCGKRSSLVLRDFGAQSVDRDAMFGQLREFGAKRRFGMMRGGENQLR